MHNVMVEHRLNLFVQYLLYLFVKAFEQWQDDRSMLQSLKVSNQAEKLNKNIHRIEYVTDLLRQKYPVEHDKLQGDIEQYLSHHLNKPNEEQYDHPKKISDLIKLR
jgi:hypothetical protein